MKTGKLTGAAMARAQENINLNFEWTLVTNSDVTAVNVLQAQGGPVFVRCTAGTAAPSNDERGLYLYPGETILGRSISDLTSLAGANRIWCRRAGGDGASTVTAYVDHA